jgi:hypothetical protein
MSITIALHTIGQTPRPDLTPFIIAALGEPDVRVTGALDGLEMEQVPGVDPDDFPLETKMSDGARVEVGAAFLQARIQDNIDRLEDEAHVHVVLCAGPFPELRSKGSLVRPFEHACDSFHRDGLSSLLVIVPFEAQVRPAFSKWNLAGFSVDVRSMTERTPELAADLWLIEIGSVSEASALVLDYVGYSKVILDRVSEALPVPVFDLGYLATDFARDIIKEMRDLLGE